MSFTLTIPLPPSLNRSYGNRPQGCEVRIEARVPRQPKPGQIPQISPRGGGEADSTGLRRVEVETAATGQRRGSQGLSRKADTRQPASVGGVLKQLRRRGINVAAERVHVLAGGELDHGF